MKIENIKFKAKRLDNGEWVKGDLVHSTSYVGISYPSDEFSDVPVVHRVDPSTVCMFTGLKDSEGNEIWEGDTLEGVSNCEVIFEKGTFAVRSFDDIFNKGIMELVTPLHYLKREDGMIECKVIGNKFDKEK